MITQMYETRIYQIDFILKMRSHGDGTVCIYVVPSVWIYIIGLKVCIIPCHCDRDSISQLMSAEPFIVVNYNSCFYIVQWHLWLTFESINVVNALSWNIKIKLNSTISVYVWMQET